MRYDLISSLDLQYTGAPKQILHNLSLSVITENRVCCEITNCAYEAKIASRGAVRHQLKV